MGSSWNLGIATDSNDTDLRGRWKLQHCLAPSVEICQHDVVQLVL